MDLELQQGELKTSHPMRSWFHYRTFSQMRTVNWYSAEGLSWHF